MVGSVQTLPEDRRRIERYPLAVPLLIGTRRGVTRDISRSGVYFLTAGTFDPGQLVKLSIPSSSFEKEGSSLACTGRVARLELEDGALGVAVKFDPSPWATSKGRTLG